MLLFIRISSTGAKPFPQDGKNIIQKPRFSGRGMRIIINHKNVFCSFFFFEKLLIDVQHLESTQWGSQVTKAFLGKKNNLLKFNRQLVIAVLGKDLHFTACLLTTQTHKIRSARHPHFKNMCNSR